MGGLRSLLDCTLPKNTPIAADGKGPSLRLFMGNSEHHMHGGMAMDTNETSISGPLCKLAKGALIFRVLDKLRMKVPNCSFTDQAGLQRVLPFSSVGWFFF